MPSRVQGQEIDFNREKVYYGIPWAQELGEAAADGFDDLVSLKIDICDLKPDEPAQPTQAIQQQPELWADPSEVCGMLRTWVQRCWQLLVLRGLELPSLMDLAAACSLLGKAQNLVRFGNLYKQVNSVLSRAPQWFSGHPPEMALLT